ncbi:homeobox protein caupolican [Caerostris extrusa]|uniref:Homeobox protein caupolican n=1 Tax=Caerostris extrusa TaxID=172846 RepID=A0AAV4QF45_CAEEX|nr:homeobox protein caupolican [Caerostris extrusa]
MPCNDAMQNVNRHIMDYTQFYSNQMTPMGPTLDIRNFHPSFLRASAFPYPVGYTCAPPAMYHTPPVTTLSKTKAEEEFDFLAMYALVVLSLFDSLK